MRILVIEDDADIRSICERIFAWAGHDVASAVDGEPGLDLVGSLEPDVIALDISDARDRWPRRPRGAPRVGEAIDPGHQLMSSAMTSGPKDPTNSSPGSAVHG